MGVCSFSFGVQFEATGFSACRTWMRGNGLLCLLDPNARHGLFCLFYFVSSCFHSGMDMSVGIGCSCRLRPTGP